VKITQGGCKTVLSAASGCKTKAKVKTEGGWRKDQSKAFRCNSLQLAATGRNKEPRKGSKSTKYAIWCDWVMLA